MDYFRNINTDEGERKNDSTNLEDYYSSSIDRKKILIELLKPFVLRRLKRDVLTDLPNKTELMISHDLSKVQKELYKAILTKNRCKRKISLSTIFDDRVCVCVV